MLNYYLFIFIGLLLFVFIGFLANYVSPIGHGNFYKPTVNKDINNNIDIVTLGTSHNIAVVHNKIEGSVIELWTSGQNIQESIFILQNTPDKYLENKLILFPVTIGTLTRGSEIRISTMANAASINNILFVNYIFSEKLKHNIDIWLKFISRDDRWIPIIKKFLNLFNNGKSTNTPFNEKKSVNRILGQIKTIHSNNSRNISTLKSLLVSVNNHASCFILYEAPISFKYLKLFEKYKPELTDWKIEFRDFIENNKNDLCVFFIEDIWPLDMSKNNTYYSDIDHLNTFGGTIFTYLLQKKLEVISKKPGLNNANNIE